LDGNNDLDSDNWATARAANTSLLGSSAGTPQTTSILCSGTSIDFFGTSIALTPFRLQVYRDSSDTIQDTMVGDAELLCVEVRNNI
jgi:hypothetical protein